MPGSCIPEAEFVKSSSRKPIHTLGGQGVGKRATPLPLSRPVPPIPPHANRGAALRTAAWRPSSSSTTCRSRGRGDRWRLGGWRHVSVESLRDKGERGVGAARTSTNDGEDSDDTGLLRSPVLALDELSGNVAEDELVDGGHCELSVKWMGRLG